MEKQNSSGILFFVGHTYTFGGCTSAPVKILYLFLHWKDLDAQVEIRTSLLAI